MKIERRSFLKTMGIVAGIVAGGPALFASKRVALPKVLILGDSISIGYTPHVKEILLNEAEVVRPAGNCQGTKNGVLKIEEWLGDARWDVIHFNFGLHDLKHVDASGKNSMLAEDPQQSDLKKYTKNLKRITSRLRQTGARLIFATTTPFPDRPEGPFRRAEDAEKYNRAAFKIMKRNKVSINDLYTFSLPRLETLQIPNNVHFTKEGSQILAQQVAESIRHALRS